MDSLPSYPSIRLCFFHHHALSADTIWLGDFGRHSLWAFSPDTFSANVNNPYAVLYLIFVTTGEQQDGVESTVNYRSSAPARKVNRIFSKVPTFLFYSISCSSVRHQGFSVERIVFQDRRATLTRLRHSMTSAAGEEEENKRERNLRIMIAQK